MTARADRGRRWPPRILDFRPELPQLRVPVSLIVDDSAPCISLPYYDQKQRGGVSLPRTSYGQRITRTVPLDFVEAFCLLVSKFGVKGKFSVIPFPAGLGSIARGLRGFPKRDLRQFIALVKSYLLRSFDITPEMLTHTLALDLESERLLPISEHDWSQEQGIRTLTAYLSRAFEILNEVSLKPHGVTSPCDFGRRVEKKYAKALLNAEQRINGRSFTWYFLHVLKDAERVEPRMAYLDADKAQAVVSIPSATGDFFSDTLKELGTDADYLDSILNRLLTPEGRGRIGELISAGSYLPFLAHWQSFYSNGTRAGLALLARLLERMKQVLGDRIIWMKCSEMARYFAATHACQVEAFGQPGGVSIQVRSPFSCSDFTATLTLPQPTAEVMVSQPGRRLRRLSRLGPTRPHLNPHSCLEREGRLHLCFDLEGPTNIEIEFA